MVAATGKKVEFVGPMHFELVGDIEAVETIAIGGRIREVMRLHREYGTGALAEAQGHRHGSSAERTHLAR